MKNPSDQSEIILELSRALTKKSKSEIEQSIARVLAGVSSYLDAHRAYLYLSDETSGSHSLFLQWHERGQESQNNVYKTLKSKDHYIWGRPSQNQHFLFIANTQNLPDSYPFDSKLFNDNSCSSFIQHIIHHDQDQLGFMAFLRNHNNSQPDREFRDFLQTVSQLIKLLLINHGIVKISKPAETVHSNKIESVETYDQMFENLPYGVVVFDTFLQKVVYSNRQVKELLDKPVSEKLSSGDLINIFRQNGYNSHDLFRHDVKNILKDFTLTHQGRYLNGTISPIKDVSKVIISFSDITPITNYEKAGKTFNLQMKIISEAAINLISSGKEKDDIYNYIGEVAYNLLQNSIIIVNKYNDKEGLLKTVYAKGMGFTMDAVIRLLGKHPLKKTYPLNRYGEEYQQIISTRAVELKNGLNELSMGSVTEPVARKLEKLLNINRIIVCGLYVNENLYGTIAFMLRPESDVNNYVLETFARMVSSAINGFETSRKLSKTTKVLSDAAAIARIGYWEYQFCKKGFEISRDLYFKIDPADALQISDEEVFIPIDLFLSRYTSAQDAARIRDAIDKAFKNRKKERFTIEIEFTLLIPGKDPLNIYTRGVVIKEKKISGVGQDVTKMKRVENNLWESEIKFQNLVEQSLDAIVVVQENGIITEWNPQAEEISGMPAEETIGKNVWEVESELLIGINPVKEKLIDPEEQLRRLFFSHFDNNNLQKTNTAEVTIRKKSGDLVYLSVTSFVFVANQRKFLCRISKDITFEKNKQEREKHMEILEKTAKAKDLFLDNMSHEMRTPLSGIIGMTDILLHTRMNAQQMEMLKVVKESSDSLLELISNIHELSRLESDGIVVIKKPFRVAVMLEKTLSIFKASAIQKSIELNIKDNTAGDLMLIGDEFRIRQVIGNLVGNAIKFTPPGGKVEAIAYTKKTNDGLITLMVEVSDTGIGIEEEKIPLLFNKFTQVDSSYTREHEGIGIGLTICREIIKLMGGDIGVKSEHRKGSVFWIKIDLPYKEDN